MRIELILKYFFILFLIFFLFLGFSPSGFAQNDIKYFVNGETTKIDVENAFGKPDFIDKNNLPVFERWIYKKKVYKSTSSEVNNYFEKCEQVVQASLLYLVKRIADKGVIYDKTKFRIEDKNNKIYAFKPKQERFFCFFFVNKEIIITSAHCKKKQKLDKRELKKAINIRKEYMNI